MNLAAEDSEDDDHFYDSVDRAPSSSPSSSSSDSPPHQQHRRGTDSRCPAPKLPAASSAEKYSHWMTDSFSCSVEKRRDRLLRALGLEGEGIVERRKRSARSDLCRSVSADELSERPPVRDENCGSGGGFGMVRSKCDDQNCNLLFPLSSIYPNLNTVNSCNDSDSDVVGEGDEDRNRKSESVLVDGVLCNEAVSSSSKLRSSSVDGNQSVGGGNGVVGMTDLMCTIKNLDNGEEFVVNEIREDGKWEKVKEVGTGRQLSIEEFDMCVGHSPIVQELMRRQNVEERGKGVVELDVNGNGENGSKVKKKVTWLKSVKTSVAGSVRGSKERHSCDEKDTSSEKGGGRRSSFATDDNQDASFHGPEKVRVTHYGKSVKEISALYKCQEIQAHNGSIWTLKLSLDGRFLASAGEDCVIHVWQVVEMERKGELLMDRLDEVSLNLLFMMNGALDLNPPSPDIGSPVERKRRGRVSVSRKSLSVDHIVVPEMIFGLSEKPFCSFLGHLDDVLDLSWSKSQLLLSSSMDKTVRLWNLSSKTCLKVFSHSDYVTCIQFNPVDDRYFISGSLDAKARIWSIPDRQVVDWNDLHEMVTAASYTPDGQGALVGTYKGSCRQYNTSENKLQQKGQINLRNKRRKSHLKKITGFQFASENSSEVLITSADSRIRVVDGVDVVHKFKGFRNSNSQISAAVSANEKHVVCASEDSHVYVWNHEGDSQPSRSKGVTVSSSYEHFHCPDVYVAIPWPGSGNAFGPQDTYTRQTGTWRHRDELGIKDLTMHAEEFSGTGHPKSISENSESPFRETASSNTNSYFHGRMATWPEEKLLSAIKNRGPQASLDFSNGIDQNSSAWGMVIVTAGLRGRIRTFQNFGLPVRL